MVLLETKTGSVKDGITELYKNNNKKHAQINKKKLKKCKQNLLLLNFGGNLINKVKF